MIHTHRPGVSAPRIKTPSPAHADAGAHGPATTDAARFAAKASALLAAGGPLDATGAALLTLARDAGGSAIEPARLGALLSAMPTQIGTEAVLLGAWLAVGAGGTGADGHPPALPWALRAAFALRTLEPAELARMDAGAPDAVKLPEALRLGACLLEDPVATLLEFERDPQARLSLLRALCRIPGAMDNVALDAALRDCTRMAGSDPIQMMALATCLVHEAPPPASPSLGRLAALRSALLPALLPLLLQADAAPGTAASPAWETLREFYAAGARHHGDAFLERERDWLRQSTAAAPLMSRLETLLEAARAPAPAAETRPGGAVASKGMPADDAAPPGRPRDRKATEALVSQSLEAFVASSDAQANEADVAFTGSTLAALERLPRPVHPAVLGELAKRVREYTAASGRAANAHLFGLIAEQASQWTGTSSSSSASSAPAHAILSAPQAQALLRQVFDGPPYLDRQQMDAAHEGLCVFGPAGVMHPDWLPGAMRAAQQAWNAAIRGEVDGKTGKPAPADAAAMAHIENVGRTLVQMVATVLLQADGPSRRPLLMGLLRVAAAQETLPDDAPLALITVLRAGTTAFTDSELIEATFDVAAGLPAAAMEAALGHLSANVARDSTDSPQKMTDAIKQLLRRVLAPGTAPLLLNTVADGLCNHEPPLSGTVQLLPVLRALSDLRSVVDSRHAQAQAMAFLDRAVAHVCQGMERVAGAGETEARAASEFPIADASDRRRILGLLADLTPATPGAQPSLESRLCLHPDTLMVLGKLLHGAPRGQGPAGGMEAKVRALCDCGLAVGDVGFLLTGLVRQAGAGAMEPAALAAAVRVLATRPTSEAAVLTCHLHVAHQVLREPGVAGMAEDRLVETPAQLRERITSALGPSGDAAGQALPPGIALGLELAENPLAAVRASGLVRDAQLALLGGAWATVAGWCPRTLDDLLAECTAIAADDPGYAVEAAIRLVRPVVPGAPADSALEALFQAASIRLTPRRLARLADLLVELRPLSIAHPDELLRRDPADDARLTEFVRSQAKQLLATEAGRNAGAHLRSRLQSLSEASRGLPLWG